MWYIITHFHNNYDLIVIIFSDFKPTFFLFLQVRSPFNVMFVGETSHRYGLVCYVDLPQLFLDGKIILRYLIYIYIYRLGIYRHICGDILERNRTSVSYVVKGKIPPLYPFSSYIFPFFVILLSPVFVFFVSLLFFVSLCVCLY